MQTFPNFSNVKEYIKDELDKRVDNPNYLSTLNSWVRVSSGVGEGIMLMSNPDYKLLSAAGGSSIYGDDKTSGVIGTDWNGNPVFATSGQGFRPSPTTCAKTLFASAKICCCSTGYTIRPCRDWRAWRKKLRHPSRCRRHRWASFYRRQSLLQRPRTSWP